MKSEVFINKWQPDYPNNINKAAREEMKADLEQVIKQAILDVFPQTITAADIKKEVQETLASFENIPTTCIRVGFEKKCQLINRCKECEL